MSHVVQHLCGYIHCPALAFPHSCREKMFRVSFHNLLESAHSDVRFLYIANAMCNHTVYTTKDGDAYFLPCHQQVLVHVGAQEACVAVTLHQLVDVVLNGKSVGKREREDTWV